jgi:hypothetical protein
VIDLKVSRLLGTLVGVLTILLMLAFITPQAEDATVNASGAAVTRPGMRQFYLTEYSSDADSALGICAAGYHLASLWEIVDPTNLQYNPSLGRQSVDSGLGPPSDQLGWVRTGYSTDSSTTPGQANCSVWSGSSGSGSVVNLHDYWTDGGQYSEVWNAGTTECDLARYVWCVED